LQHMPGDQITRRNVLKSLGIGVAAGSVLQTIPLQAAQYIHGIIEAEKSNDKAGGYQPKFFSAPQYKTLQSLCESILPADANSGGAVEAGAPEFVDLITSENTDYQLLLGGGLMWLDSTCIDKYGKCYLDCAPEQQTEILNRIAYRKNAVLEPGLSQGIEFFSILRNLTSDGFFTSKIGIQYLGYVGNTFLTNFPGCPPVPGV